MQVDPRIKRPAKAIALVALLIIAGCIGAAMTSHFGTSSISISYTDFISLLLTCLGVMLAVVTLFVAVLAVIGWTSIETRLRAHSIEFIGSELQDDKPLNLMIRKAVRDAVYEGVVPADEESEADVGGDGGEDGGVQ